jgi:hypothetical protein
MWSMTPKGNWSIKKGSNVTIVSQPDGAHLGFVTSEEGRGTGKK